MSACDSKCRFVRVNAMVERGGSSSTPPLIC
jgi:hypothetical protein